MHNINQQHHLNMRGTELKIEQKSIKLVCMLFLLAQGRDQINVSIQAKTKVSEGVIVSYFCNLNQIGGTCKIVLAPPIFSDNILKPVEIIL